MNDAPFETETAAASTLRNPRLAPQNLEAERSILGGVLLTNEALYDVAEIVKSEDFYREPHRQIFAAIQALSQRSEPIDVVTLGDELRRMGKLDDVGGVAYLNTLDVPTRSNLSSYAKIVRDKALARRLIEAAHMIAREGYEQSGDVDTLLDAAEQKILDIVERRPRGDLEDSATIVKRVFTGLEVKYERRSEITGIPTGFEHLDRMTAGFQRGDLIIIAGRPSMGKTSVALNMAAHVAIERKLPVVVFSLEMSSDSLMERNFSSEARVDGQRVRNGQLLDSDWPKLARAADRLARMPMWFGDVASLTVMEMRAQCRRLHAKKGPLGLVVVDYLQLMTGRSDEEGREGREREVAEISRGLKQLAKELKVPVIALSQLNRSLERREDKRPQLSDLRESGAVEQDADVICFIYRDEVYNKESADKGIAEIIVGKQRAGPTGTVRVAFHKDYTRFDNLEERGTWG